MHIYGGGHTGAVQGELSYLRVKMTWRGVYPEMVHGECCLVLCHRTQWPDYCECVFSMLGGWWNRVQDFCVVLWVCFFFFSLSLWWEMS